MFWISTRYSHPLADWVFVNENKTKFKKLCCVQIYELVWASQFCCKSVNNDKNNVSNKKAFMILLYTYIMGKI